MVDVALAGDVDDDLVDRAAGEPKPLQAARSTRTLHGSRLIGGTLSTTPPTEPPVELRGLIESPQPEPPDEGEPEPQERLGPLAVASAFEIAPA